ncbi:MAG: sodium:solute symporter family protein [Candidatus Marinimicrobia bacterium]|nr:sodium:solute symporter family protein [Candidatus Neomarinimicrobiota bacterium]
MALYIATLTAIGFGRRRTSAARTDHYLLGGRRLTLVPFVATLVSTWYGGILGIGEFTFRNGLVNLVVFGMPYYVFAAIYAVVLAPAIRQSDDLTIPDRLLACYGPRMAKWGAVLVFLLSTPAPYLLMLAVLLKMVVGLALWQGLLLGALISTAYLWRGGFLAVVRTDLLQAALMFAGFGALVFLLTRQMPLTEMWNGLPEGHRQLLGAESLPWQTVLVWFFIASWTFVDPGFYQRCAAAKNPRTARRGILLSIAAWFVFDLLTTTAGLYAVVRLPGLSDAVEAFPALGFAILPPGLKGLFFVALLAVIMSTIDSTTFISGITLGRDLLGRGASRPPGSGAIRLGMAVALGLGIMLALAVPSVVELWFTLGSLLIPGLLAPMLVTFTARWQLTDDAAFAAGLSGVGVSLLWYIWPILSLTTVGGAGAYPLGLEPMIPGLLVSMAMVLGLGNRARVEP